MSKTDFLGQVRQSLGRSAGPPLKPYYRLEEDITELRERAETLSKPAWLRTGRRCWTVSLKLPG